MKGPRGFPFRRAAVVVVVVAFAGLALAGAAAGERLYAVTSTNHLLSFDSATPGTLTRNVAITGIGAGDLVAGIDCRSPTGQLYLVVDSATAGQGKLYTVNAITGVAAQVGSAFAMTGGFPGFDLNPVVDVFRVVSETDENFRLNPTTAVPVIDIALAFAAGDPNFGQNPTVNGLAYTSTPTLYGIDSALDILVGVGFGGSPNGGQLTTIGSLSVDTSAYVGFDVAPGGTAYASLTTGAASPQSSLYTINLSTGAAALVGAIGTVGDAVWPVSGLTAACGALSTRVYSFAAKRGGRGVVVRWRTGSEEDTLGFNVYRQVKGKRAKVNRRLIPAKSVTGSSTTGGAYTYVDRRAPRRATIRYWLQVVALNGSRTWQGPVRVSARS